MSRSHRKHSAWQKKRDKAWLYRRQSQESMHLIFEQESRQAMREIEEYLKQPVRKESDAPSAE